ncbi:MAG TPA: haloacid dehalogenase [Rhodospirillaceae bacterium]|nr:haloacid dehalogenase [Rhodospirillaceae bacterium]
MIVNSEDLDAIIFDFDGVLTDNRVLVFGDGTEAVWCNRADGLAFDRLRTLNFPTFIVSTETSAVVRARGTKLQIPVLHGVVDKAIAIKALCADHGFSADRLMFVGNDINDLPAIDVVGYPIAVADAHPQVIDAAKHVLSRKGGQGVAREVMEAVIRFPVAN